MKKIKKISSQKKLENMSKIEVENFNVERIGLMSGSLNPNVKPTPEQEKKLENYIACTYDSLSQNKILYINAKKEMYIIVEINQNNN
tara:strand:+ start:373 stop:633 length:261 start_codon:yes stop_codon:yes gene_type:complete